MAGAAGWRAAAGVVALLALGGCRERIQHALDERQANALQTVLRERGVAAHKEAEGGKAPTWALEVAAEQAPDAVRILAELGLPRQEEAAGCDVFGGGGLVRTPLEEQVCRVRALERGLEKTLEALDGVLLARVHLVLPAAPRPGQPAPASKASVLLRTQPGGAAGVRAREADLRALVAGGAEGLAPEAVSLLVDEVASRPLAAPAGAAAARRLRVLAAVLGGAVAVLSALVLGVLLRRRRARGRPGAAPVRVAGAAAPGARRVA